MDDLREQCYRLNVFILSMIGLWPHKTTKSELIKSTVASIILICAIILQLTNILCVQHTTQKLLHNLSTMMMTIGCSVKYCSFIVTGDKIKKMMQRVKNDWNSITNINERRLIEQHAVIGRQYTNIFALLIYQSALLLVLGQYASTFLDYAFPLNETRPHFSVVDFEAFTFPEKHHHIFTLYLNAAIFLIASTFVGTENLYMMWFHHAASLLKITTYRMKLVFCDSGLEMQISRKNASYDMLVIAVSMHKHATQFIDDLMKICTIPYFCLLVCGVSSISFNLYGFAVAFPYQRAEVLISASYLFAEMGYMFYLFFTMQQIVDISTIMFREVYNTKWYEASLTMQKQLIFIFLKTSKPLVLGVNGVIVGSLPVFAAICKTSLSYFMAIYSIQ